MNVRLLSCLALIPALSFAAPAPAPSPTRAPAPDLMPNDAQCLALGNVVSPLPWKPGEVLEFDIDALGAKAGTMTLRALAPRDGLFPVEAEVATNTFFNKIRKVHGTGRSDLSAKTLRPARYFEDAWENEVHRVADVRFGGKNHTAHLTSTIDGRTGQADLRYGSDVLDVAGAVHVLRSLPFKQGQPMCFDVYGIRRIWRVWGTVLPREHVSVPLGEFEAWHLKGQAARLDMPNAHREVHVWVTDDARRLPLAALGMIDLGAVRASLTGFTRPREKSAQVQNKGDIKW